MNRILLSIFHSCLKDERTFAAPTCPMKFFPGPAARSGLLPLAAHERTVTVGRAEINVDAADLVARKHDHLGVAEALAVLGGAAIGREGHLAVDTNAFEVVMRDPVAAAPATGEVSRLVDPVIIGAGEAE